MRSVTAKWSFEKCMKWVDCLPRRRAICRVSAKKEAGLQEIHRERRELREFEKNI